VDGVVRGGWPPEVCEILGGDLTVGIGMPTRMGGVSLSTVTTLGMHDPTDGTVSFTTSLGFGRKLERIADDPRIAVAYHTRQHGRSERPGYVLVQGHASVVVPDDRRRAEVEERAGSFLGQVASGWFWDRWLRVYYHDRVLVDVSVERLLWWPDGDTAQEPELLGGPLPVPDVPPQTPPKDATTARVPLRKVARKARKLPHQLIGVVQADGMPVLLPVRAIGTSQDALRIEARSPLLPQGERRAGYLAHDFRPGLIGLDNATHTGWLRVGADRQALWTPHSRHAFTAPPNKTVLLLANGFLARRGYKQAIEQGRDEILAHAAGRSRP
jgi:hypothetical protein